MPPSAPNSPLWITATVDELLVEVESLGRRRAEALIDLGLDVAAHQRQFWDHWGTLPDEMSVAARNRACDYECRALAAEVIGRRASIASLTARYDAVVAVLDVRRGRPMHDGSVLDDLIPPDQGLSVLAGG